MKTVLEECCLALFITYLNADLLHGLFNPEKSRLYGRGSQKVPGIL
jgi:hypothetical protein